MKTALLRTNEAADRLRISRATVYNLFQRNLLPHIKIENRTFVREQDIEELLKKNLKYGPVAKISRNKGQL